MIEFLNRRKPQSSQESKETPKEHPVSPYAEAVIAAFDRHYRSEATPERRAMVREIVETFFHETLQNINLHTAKEHTAAYPWGVIDTGTLAKKLHERVTNTQAGPLKLTATSSEKTFKKKEFIFGSLLFRMHGTPFMYQEEALHQLVKNIPAALQAIERGEEPESLQVYTFGSPTNLLGTMSPQFQQEMKERGAFEAFGDLYANHIAAILSEENNPDTKVRLYGMSLGGALAVAVAQNLLERHAVTQEAEEKRPHLQVRIEEAPASSHTPPGLKALQTGAGFFLDGAFATARDPYVKAVWGAEKQFVRDVNAHLTSRSENPLAEDMSPEQKKMKQAGLRSLVGALLKGRAIPPHMKVTEIVGLNDPLLFSPLFIGKAAYQRATRFDKETGKRPLHRHLVIREGADGERKRYGIRMPHVPPFYRENELKRLERAAEYLERAKRGTLTSTTQENP